MSGMGYERVADATCSPTTLRRRRDEWTAAGAGEVALHLAALSAYDPMIGLANAHSAPMSRRWARFPNNRR